MKDAQANRSHEKSAERQIDQNVEQYYGAADYAASNLTSSNKNFNKLSIDIGGEEDDDLVLFGQEQRQLYQNLQTARNEENSGLDLLQTPSKNNTRHTAKNSHAQTAGKHKKDKMRNSYNVRDGRPFGDGEVSQSGAKDTHQDDNKSKFDDAKSNYSKISKVSKYTSNMMNKSTNKIND